MNCQAFVETLNNSIQQTSHIAICHVFLKGIAKQYKEHASLSDTC